MRVLTSLLFKATLSSMILTAPAMINGTKGDVANWKSGAANAPEYNSAKVINQFISHSPLTAKAVYNEKMDAFEYDECTVASPVLSVAPAMSYSSGAVAGREAAVRLVIDEADFLYDSMNLAQTGLNAEAFEYAWRGYHNLVRKGILQRKNVLTICDFSQSSCCKRLYVIDLRHMKLLYQTYVAHGQNSGSEFADDFSNEPESFKSSLGFYITARTYYGHNGLSLRIDGVDTGYNDKASLRHIVLHGSSYVSDQYMEENGILGTSLGCPAIPLTMGPKIIPKVKGGSCLFIYHQTKKYLERSSVING